MTNIHERNAGEFIDALRERLGKSLHAVALYGSVARGQARADSDVDLLVVTAMPAGNVIDDVAYEIDFGSRFTTFLVPVEFSPEQLEYCLHTGDPFLESVLKDAKLLYDDGTFKDIHDRIVAHRA
jgi:predicted nucleotidyltransferase